MYIHDYLVKRDLKATAQAFQAEGKVSSDPVGEYIRIFFHLLIPYGMVLYPSLILIMIYEFWCYSYRCTWRFSL